MPEDLSPSLPPDRGAFIGGLQLRNASWDNVKSVLTENICAHTVHTFPIIWAKPSGDIDDNRPACAQMRNKFLCPLYSARDSHQQSDTNILWEIPLTTSEPPSLWSQMRVALTLDAVNLHENFSN